MGKLRYPSQLPIIYLISSVIICLSVLLRVAFFTLIERKIIALMHYRKGPIKVSIIGYLQPISDAIKLLTKENLKLSFSLNIILIRGPIVRIIIIIICWLNFNSIFNHIRNNIKILVILSVISLSSFSFILCGWGSNSKYTILGTNRAISQAISYEVCLFLIILTPLYLIKSYNPQTINFLSNSFPFIIWILPLFLIWFTLCLAESNRTPFDMSEGESEIVSGFNIEYGGGIFALIFIREYGIILFIRFITTLIFLNLSMLLLKIIIIRSLFIWTRCCFPRLRYDHLIIIAWKLTLPLSLGVLTLRIMCIL